MTLNPLRQVPLVSLSHPSQVYHESPSRSRSFLSCPTTRKRSSRYNSSSPLQQGSLGSVHTSPCNPSLPYLRPCQAHTSHHSLTDIDFDNILGAQMSSSWS